MKHIKLIIEKIASAAIFFYFIEIIYILDKIIDLFNWNFFTHNIDIMLQISNFIVSRDWSNQENKIDVKYPEKKVVLTKKPNKFEHEIVV